MARTGRGTTQEAVRRHNLATLLGHLHQHGPTSRARLTRLLGLNRATIGDLVDDLAGRGLVGEAAEPERRARGRPSKVVGVRPDTHAVLAVHIGVGAVELGLIGLGGTVIARRRRGLGRGGDRSLERVVRSAARLGERVLADAPPGLALVGAGVAVPGAVDPVTELVRYAPNLGWRAAPVGERLQAALGLAVPVRVGNDANLGAMAEHARGAGSRVNDLIYVHAEVGVGGGIITGGRMLEGAHGNAGEVGHILVNPGGDLCHCGVRGCWETETGELALLRRAGLADAGPDATPSVMRRARRGDPVCRAAVEATAIWISAGLAVLVNTLNPELLILGGMFEDVLELAAPTLREHLDRGVYDAEDQRPELARPRFGRATVLLGAAELAFQGVLVDPTVIPQGGPAPPALRGTPRPAPGAVAERPAAAG